MKMDKKPTLEELGLDAPVPPSSAKKSIEQIANEIDSEESASSIKCRKCTKLIHRHASVCAYCKTPVLPSDVIQPVQIPPLKTKKCRYCMTPISIDASKCPNCQEWLVEKKDWNGAAAILSFLIPGLGQLYKGEIGRGLVLFIVTLIGYVFFIVPGLLLHLLTVADAGKRIRQLV